MRRAPLRPSGSSSRPVARRAFLAATGGALAAPHIARAAGAAARYRVAVIGHTGRGNYGHGLDRVWKDVPEADLVAVADADAKGLAAAKERLGPARVYGDYRQLLETEQPDLVSICPRWLDQHADMVTAAAGAGVKGIFLEKPMCRSMEEADRMVEACERAGTRLVIAHQTRYSPRLAVVRRMIESGRIGRPLEIRGRGKEDRRGGGEDLWVLGSHILDLMHAIGGAPQWCFGRVLQEGRRIRKDDVKPGSEGIGPLAGDEVHAQWRLESGMMATFDSVRGTGARPTRFGLFVMGSEGIIELHTGFLPATHYLPDPGWSPGQTGKRWIPVTSAGAGRPEPLGDGSHHAGNVRAVRDLIASIEAGRAPYSGVHEARVATEMILSVFESERQGGPVALPLESRRHPLELLG